MSNYEDTPYNELKSVAAGRNLKATGTKEELIERLEADDAKGGSDPAPEVKEADEPEVVEEDKQEEKKEEKSEKVGLNQAEERAAQGKADRALRSDAKKMKEHLEKQPTVGMMIPFEAGEDPEAGSKVPFSVNLNGYRVDYPRGEFIQVPQQIADIIKERLESEGKIGKKWRIDHNPDKQEYLSR